MGDQQQDHRDAAPEMEECENLLHAMILADEGRQGEQAKEGCQANRGIDPLGELKN